MQAERGVTSFNITAIMPTNKRDLLTEQQKEEFLKVRTEELEKVFPETNFEEDVEELTWQWARHLLPRYDKRRQEKANHKRRVCLKNPQLYKQFRLFKPLIMKHPTLAGNLTLDRTTIQSKKLVVNADFLENEERIAGFSYTDFAKVVVGDGMVSSIKVGDILTGTVMSLTDKGAFVEVGAKTWGFVPLDAVSLKPIATADQVLNYGDDVTVKVMALDGESQLPGDRVAQQIMLSMTDLARENAWEQIAEMVTGQQSNIVEVEVQSVKTWGAVVQMDNGLEGCIPTRFMATWAGDTSLMGTRIRAQFNSCDREKDVPGMKLRPTDFPLTFSLENLATYDLSQVVEVGDVLDAKVKEVKDATVDIMVRGAIASIKKMDISSVTQYNLPDLFKDGEEIKVYVISKLDSGAIRFSTRALEYSRGELLTNKERVWERAEETAKKYLSSAKKAMEATEKSLAMALGEELEPEEEEEKTTGSVEDVIDDDDDDMGF